VQQALDLIVRVLIKPGDAVWMEDPELLRATMAFETVAAPVIAVPVDEQGFPVAKARRMYEHAKVAYVTPAHQFPLGVSMPRQRRLELLEWAKQESAFILRMITVVNFGFITIADRAGCKASLPRGPISSDARSGDLVRLPQRGTSCTSYPADADPVRRALLNPPSRGCADCRRSPGLKPACRLLAC
jgi:hypothetical protein